MLKYIIFTIIFIIPFNLFSQSNSVRIEKGIDHIYHIKFDSAESEFKSIIASDPDHPVGYFFLAMIDWWKINLNKDKETFDEKFFKEVDKVVEVSEARLDKNEFDDEAMFYKGGALGYRGLVRSLRESWFKAAEDGKEALNLMQKAHEINKNNKDVIFGVGLYNYFAEYVPEAYPVVKPLMLIFPKGDKLKGLSQIKETSLNSRYAKNEARFVLTYLNLVYEKNYVEAESYAKFLHEDFPENPIFEKYLYSSYIGQAKWNEALEGWKNVIEKIDSGRFGYNSDGLIRESNYYAALSLSKVNRILEAEPYILRAENITNKMDKDEDHAYTSFIYLLAGMMNDVKDNKSTADIYYDRVLSMKNFQNSHAEAEKFKRVRFRQ
ncbi:MAG: hypothetical protein ABIY50_01860 [Ignavibacteria bacterium]